MKIYGAGLAGLLAGCQFQTARIYEANSESSVNHKAVLRFRTPAVGDAVGIDFRQVRVHKGIWDAGKYVQPSILLANQYSNKVVGRLADRSIWNLDPVDRFIAPENLIGQLAERCFGRIKFNHRVTKEEFLDCSEAAISTMPMRIAAQLSGHTTAVEADKIFSYAPITVRRWRIPGADVFQTVYFPNPTTTLYRASITGDLLIAEYAGEEDGYPLLKAFGLRSNDIEPIERVKQVYGKISPIDNNWRKKVIFDLSTQNNIFSLGRFATWRNILLDDVIQDISVIKKLLNTTTYDRSRLNVK